MNLWVNSDGTADGVHIFNNFQPTLSVWYYFEAIADYGNDTVQLYIDGSLDCENASVGFDNAILSDESTAYNDHIFNQRTGVRATLLGSIANLIFEN